MGTSKLVYIGAGVLFLIALFFLHHFWPDQDKQKLQAIFLLLQFAATLALLAVTAYYATAAWALVESQNREPEIRILGAPILPTAPGSAGAEFSMEITFVISNPGVRATTVRVERVEINAVTARNVILRENNINKWHGVTVAGGGLSEVTASAAFTDASVFPPRVVKLVVEDLFRQNRLSVTWTAPEVA